MAFSHLNFLDPLNTKSYIFIRYLFMFLHSRFSSHFQYDCSKVPLPTRLFDTLNRYSYSATFTSITQPISDRWINPMKIYICDCFRVSIYRAFQKSLHIVKMNRRTTEVYLCSLHLGFIHYLFVTFFQLSLGNMEAQTSLLQNRPSSFICEKRLDSFF